MDTARIIVLTAALLLVGVLYNKYIAKDKKNDALADYKLIEEYLLNDSSLATSRKPLLWIHLDYATNARHWLSFFSRNTKEVNQPYLNLTLKSIIEKCGDSFNICLIDDRSFEKIIPGWDVDLSRVGEPVRAHLRNIALLKTLHSYGGLLVPASFVCLQDLGGVFQQATENDNLVCAELPNQSVSADVTAVCPNVSFIGCTKGSAVCKELIEEMGRIAASDNTDAVSFQGTPSRWLERASESGKVSIIPGDLVGVVDTAGSLLGLEEYLGQSDVKIRGGALGVMFPGGDALKRLPYQWFVRMSPREVLGSNTFIGKLLLNTLDQ